MAAHRGASPFLQLVLARIREFYREPEALFWVYGFPLLMVVALGIAFRERPVEHFDVDIRSGDGAEQLAASLRSDERFEIRIGGEAECRARLRTGKTDLVVAAHAGGVRYRYDPAKPGSIVARDAVDGVLQKAAGRTNAVAVELIETVEPGGRYIDFLVPGLLGMSLMGGGLWGVGFVTVDMRIRKLLKRFVATPMRKSHFLGSLMASRLVFMVPEVLILLVFARLTFGVVSYGNTGVLVILILLGAIMFCGIGLLLACRASTLEAISGLMNLAMLPMWMLSGIFFSTERFPQAVQPFLNLLPLTPLIDALRRVMLEGATLPSLWPQLLLMVAWSVLSFAVALRWFRWT